MQQIYSIFIAMLAICNILHSALFAQDPAFSQFYSASLFLNPALAGAETDLTLTINQRIHLNKQLSPYSLSQFSIIYPVRMNRFKTTYNRKGHVGGCGFTVYNEMSGANRELASYGGYLTLAYLLQANGNHRISFSIQGGLVQKHIDFNKLRWGSQYDADIGFNPDLLPSISNYNEEIIIPVFNSGLVWYYNPNSTAPYRISDFEAFTGIAVSNLNKPDQTFFDSQISELPMLFKLHGGCVFYFSKRMQLLPNYLVMFQNNEFQTNIGGYVNYTISASRYSRNRHIVQLGTWYRYGDSFILSGAFRFNRVQVAVSYDFNVSSFQYYNKGARAFEISVSYRVYKDYSLQRNISHPLM